MEGINWPLWIIAFAVLLVAAGVTAAIVSFILAMRKISLLADTVRSLVSHAGTRLFHAIPEARSGSGWKPKLGSRTLTVLSAVLSSAARLLSRFSRRKS